MRGYPKFINSKSDYEYVLKHFPKYKSELDFQKLVEDYTKWTKVEKLAKEEDGLIDKIHKIVEEENESKEKVYYQYEFKVDPNCKMVRLRFTLQEVEKIIQEAEFKNE